MNDIVKRLSNERLEDTIARVYQEAAKTVPGVRVNEERHPFLGVLWGEFEARLAAGDIAGDIEYEPIDWSE